MIRLIVYGLICAAALYLYRALKGESQRVAQRVKRAEAEQRNGVRGTLVQDPKTGVYRVVRD
ncbi:hypothetical protein [Bartonella tamiae]|uniref:Uncharacterized protein n=1 Tax=Bartonella tamiae Th239 TaxID=1094558 RepID=J0ZPJ5_9HYPH|nr:hypothetical protein [Bartonella tamiae]EJF90503.1 hypothetical protein ME5_00904 [Bartonella tamiae Th239]EJF93553.1 hypothetical protein MEG_00977 [Bartonella tamiae Th307]